MEQEISGISKFPEKRTTSRGEPKFSKRISGKCLFHSILHRDFRKFWSNGTRPLLPGKVRVHITFIAVSLILQAQCKVILIFVISFIICALNLQYESHAGPHLAIGGCACWLAYTCQLSRIMHCCHALCMTVTQKS